MTAILAWLLIGALAVPAVPASLFVGNFRQIQTQQPWEDDSDPNRSPGEEQEEPGQACTCRLSRPAAFDLPTRRADLVRPERTLAAGLKTRIDVQMPAELAGRNGSGCTLRC